MRQLLSVIIPAHNAAPYIERCLSAIFASDLNGFECVVVDDGSSDDTSAIASKFPAKIVRLKRQRGTAYARNRGVEAASSDPLLFIDSDVLVHKDTLSKVVSHFNEHPEIAALFGSYDDDPADPGFISQYKNLFHHFVHQNSAKEASTFWGGCGAIKKEVFLKMGGFDQKYTSVIEDIELGVRLKKNGYRIELVKDMQVKHLKKWTFLNLVKADIFYRGIPWTRLMLEHGNIPKDLNLKINERVSAVLALILLASLLLSHFYFALLYVAAFAFVLLLFLNLRFYSFLLKKRGILFTAPAVPMHTFYFLYSLLAFGMGCFSHYLSGKDRRAQKAGAYVER
jgi:GT2 family glycosyltransferase